jgi:hypothetical protein
MTEEQKKLRSFVKDHKKTPEEIKAEMKVMEDAKKQYTQDVTKLQANLDRFNSTLDPLIDPTVDDPEKAVLCWIRRPTQEEWEAMIPTELLEYENMEDVPKEILVKIKDRQFDMMAKLIEKPKGDAEFWKKHGGSLVFQELFQMHIVEVYRKLGVIIGNF